MSTSIIKDSCSLNRCDVDQVQSHVRQLSPENATLLSLVDHKLQRCPSFSRTIDYVPHSYVYLLSVVNQKKRKYAYCPTPNASNPSGRCNLRKFCPHCAYHKKQRARLCYVPCFHQGTWHFFTGSYQGQTSLISDLHSLPALWDAWNAAVRKVREDELIRGIYVVEEVSLQGLYPRLQILPHIHALIEADEVSPSTLDILHEVVATQIAKLEFDFELKPASKVSPILTQKSLFDHLGYMHKPIELLKPYKAAYAQASAANEVWRLNSHITDFLMGEGVVTHLRKCIKSMGNLCATSKDFIGIRKTHKREHCQLLKELALEREEIFTEEVDIAIA